MTTENKPLRQKTYDSPGKGRKYCPRCETYIPATKRNCGDCDFKFEKGKKYAPPKPLTKEQEQEVRYIVGIGGREPTDRMIYAAAGGCPIRLTKFTKDEVHQWCELMISEGRTQGRIYLPSALMLFARNFKYKTEKTRKRVLRSIEEWANEKRNYCKDIRIRVSNP